MSNDARRERVDPEEEAEEPPESSVPVRTRACACAWVVGSWKEVGVRILGVVTAVGVGGALTPSCVSTRVLMAVCACGWIDLRIVHHG